MQTLKCEQRTLTPQRRFAMRRSRRGAMMVEAVVVISCLTFGLVGIEFFRLFYLKGMTAARLARGGLIAHSMMACEGTTQDWIGQKDLGKFTVSTPNAENQPSQGPSNTSASPSGQESGRVGGIMSKIGGTTGDGKGLLVPMTNTRLAGTAGVETKRGALSTAKTVFKKDVASRSYVGCGDKIRDGNVEEVLNKFKDDVLSMASSGK
jgi:hypothetical protein